MGNANKNSKYFSINLDKYYYDNNYGTISGNIIINDIKNIEIIEASLSLDLIEKWVYFVGSGDGQRVYTLNNKINKKFLPINLKKINKDNYLNYKIPFNFKFSDFEPTIVIDNCNYIKTVLTFEILGKFIRKGKLDKQPKKEKYESFITIKREPNYNNLYFQNFIEENLNIKNLFKNYGICKVSINTKKTQFDVEEEIPFEVNIDNNLNKVAVTKIKAYILQIKLNKTMNNLIESTYRYVYGELKEKVKILSGQKGYYKYITKIDNNKNKNNCNVTSNGIIVTNNYFICVELEFEKTFKKNEVKLPIFIGINKKNIKPMEFEVIENNFSNNYIVNIDNISNNNNNIEIINEINENETHNDSDVYGFENINYLNK
jgi:hypothetical protein